ncbi:hypothetical protein MMC19_000147 [Ptychographa xylographoides]|nr:hypothetical protein [Ptychographa xylographoides]
MPNCLDPVSTYKDLQSELQNPASPTNAGANSSNHTRVTYRDQLNLSSNCRPGSALPTSTSQPISTNRATGSRSKRTISVPSTHPTKDQGTSFEVLPLGNSHGNESGTTHVQGLTKSSKLQSLLAKRGGCGTAPVATFPIKRAATSPRTRRFPQHAEIPPRVGTKETSSTDPFAEFTNIDEIYAESNKFSDHCVATSPLSSNSTMFSNTTSPPVSASGVNSTNASTITTTYVDRPKEQLKPG